MDLLIHAGIAAKGGIAQGIYLRDPVIHTNALGHMGMIADDQVRAHGFAQLFVSLLYVQVLFEVQIALQEERMELEFDIKVTPKVMYDYLLHYQDSIL